MKLMRILMVIVAVLVATACTSSAGQGKDGGTIQPSATTKEVVLAVSAIT